MKLEYKERFLRQTGIMNEDELRRFKTLRVAIGGLGLGGSVFMNLVRMGIEDFHIADPDVYERTNVNRQRLAKETTVGCRKDDCLLQEARSINPDVRVKLFREGVTARNVSSFLDGIDWVIDAVDIFAIPEKIELHREAARRRLPVISCVSVGFGAAIICFGKDSPTFEELSGLSPTAPYEENIHKFVRFVTPRIPDYMSAQLQKALARESHIPFVVSGVELSAAMVTTELSKHLLGLGERVVAPHGVYIDLVDLEIEKFKASHLELAA